MRGVVLIGRLQFGRKTGPNSGGFGKIAGRRRRRGREEGRGETGAGERKAGWIAAEGGGSRMIRSGTGAKRVATVASPLFFFFLLSRVFARAAITVTPDPPRLP